MFCFNITFEINIHSVISEDNACSLLISLKYEPSSSRENLTSGFSTRVDSNQPAQPQKLAEWLEISDIETRDITLSMQQTTKVLCRSAGWYAPLLFAYGINKFSHDMAQLSYASGLLLSYFYALNLSIIMILSFWTQRPEWVVGLGDVAGQLPVPGCSTTLEYGRAWACCACNRCGTDGLFFGCFFVILSILSSFSNASSVGRRLDILKYCGLGRYNPAAVVSYYQRHAR